jgi:hypothetical protein
LWSGEKYIASQGIEPRPYSPSLYRLGSSENTVGTKIYINTKKKKVKLSLQQALEAHRVPYFLDSWRTDGGEVVSLTCPPSFIPRKIPGTHFF